MALQFKEIPSGGGGFFSPAEHFEDVAILVEVKKYDPARPGNFGPKPAITADMTYFATQEDLDAGTPSETASGVIIQGTALVSDLEDLVGNATIVTVKQLPPKTQGMNGAYVWRNPSASVRNKVIAYAEKREADLKAAVESGEMPDFLS